MRYYCNSLAIFWKYSGGILVAFGCYSGIWVRFVHSGGILVMFWQCFGGKQNIATQNIATEGQNIARNIATEGKNIATVAMF